MRNLSKSPLSARFHLTFPACKIKNAAKILAESATQRILPSFRRKPLVNFLGSFRSYRTSLTSRTSPRCYWEICLSDQSDQSDKSNPLSDEFESGSRALPLMGEMEGALPFFLPILLESEKNPYICSKHQTLKTSHYGNGIRVYDFRHHRCPKHLFLFRAFLPLVERESFWRTYLVDPALFDAYS